MSYKGYLGNAARCSVPSFCGILFLSGGRKGTSMSKFLSYEDRLIIAMGLKENKSFGEIGRELNKDRTTIAKEIKKYSCDKKTGKPGYPYNACKHRISCKKKGICGKECTRAGTYKCSLCSHCNEKCPDYLEEVCVVKTKPPYVCNGCSLLEKCTLLKHWYDPVDAHLAAQETIMQSRTGILSSEADIQRINKIITPLIRNGQSIHQVYLNHVDEWMCSEKTLYNYIDACLFDVRNIDLPRKVKYRPRYGKPVFKVDRGCRIGRTYKDFETYMGEHPESQLVQMDTVIGSIGGKCLLTIHFVSSSFMLAFLRESNTSQSVLDVFNGLYRDLGKEDFKKLFPVILTDNGSEFSNPKGIEFTALMNGIRRTNVFYCDSGSPYKKGSIEVNHELIRRILPKGSSFDKLEQEDINLMMNHINSYKRKKLNNKNPYDVFSFLYGEDMTKKLGCLPVPAENIVLKPYLLKK